MCAVSDQDMCPPAEAFTELTRTGMVSGDRRDGALRRGPGAASVSGDLLVLYTDGLTEMIDAQEQEFGLERLQRLILDHRGAPAAELASALTQAVTSLGRILAPWRRLCTSLRHSARRCHRGGDQAFLMQHYHSSTFVEFEEQVL